MDGPVTEPIPPADAPATERRDAALLGPLLADRRLWRGPRVADAARDAASGIPSGHPALDAALPEGGFPAAALTEVFVPSAGPPGRPSGLPPGKGEVALVLPALARLARGARLIAMVGPPAIPYAPALAAAGLDLARVVVIEARTARDLAWATEQALRDGSASAVLAWLDQTLLTTLRRLQLAAEAGGCLGVLYRPWAARRSASPAALQLALTPTVAGLRVELLKCRGTSRRWRIELPLGDGFAARAALAPGPLPGR